MVTDNVFMTILVPRMKTVFHMKTDYVNFRKKRIFQCMNKVISRNSDVSNHTSLDTFLALWKSLRIQEKTTEDITTTHRLSDAIL
jgi:hypothetical protein